MPQDITEFELWTIDQLAAASGLSRSTIRRRSSDPRDDFPKPMKIGPNAVRWAANEWARYVASRPRAVRTMAAE
ncbi:helix-turn-helix transcriptional regulator [Hyphococcus sp.]|uniref:helix-turn-helix transcriptional regulator n=1 Tax=Hyphococcus sp. TaxID=2038636 RepID=UPI0035C6D153